MNPPTAHEIRDLVSASAAEVRAAVALIALMAGSALLVFVLLGAWFVRR